MIKRVFDIANRITTKNWKHFRPPFIYKKIKLIGERPSLSVFMAPRTKRQKQINNLPRKKGCYLNQKNQIFMELLNITTIKSQEEWTENKLIEFEGVGTRLINEILRWHKDAAKHLRTGNYFIKTGELLPYRQGKHTKLESLINDENFSEDYIEWLRQQKLEKTLYQRGCVEIICIREVLNMMREERIFSLMVIRDQMWWHIGTNDKNILRSKHLGCSIMVSAFLCPCHGLLCLTDQQLYENPYIKDKETFVIHSVQVDGYWKAEHMLKQLVSKVIPVFEILHPRCIGMFCFDQSTNHNAIAEDALIAKRMNLSSGGKQPMMRNGCFIDETEKKCVQPMVFPNDYQKEELRGKQKGLRQVLEERKLWPAEKVLLVCKKCSGKCTDNGPE
ncbi:22347_t:CDS:2, partial [Cetraspora pellucida]